MAKLDAEGGMVGGTTCVGAYIGLGGRDGREFAAVVGFESQQRPAEVSRLRTDALGSDLSPT